MEKICKKIYIKIPQKCAFVIKENYLVFFRHIYIKNSSIYLYENVLKLTEFFRLLVAKNAW